MSAEMLLLILTLLDVAYVLLCFRLGKNYLITSVVANILFTNMISSKIVVVFGLESTIANVSYAAIFLATDMLNEHYGERVARTAVWMGFVAMVPIVILGPIVRLFEPSSVNVEASRAINVLFDNTPRMSTASLAAYLASNLFDVWLFQTIRRRFPSRKWLWIRKNGSTCVSQVVDEVVFCTIAFAFVLPVQAIVRIMLSGYIVKMFVAMVETPLVYLAQMMKGGLQLSRVESGDAGSVVEAAG